MLKGNWKKITADQCDTDLQLNLPFTFIAGEEIEENDAIFINPDDGKVYKLNTTPAESQRVGTDKGGKNDV